MKLPHVSGVQVFKPSPNAGGKHARKYRDGQRAAKANRFFRPDPSPYKPNLEALNSLEELKSERRELRREKDSLH